LLWRVELQVLVDIFLVFDRHSDIELPVYIFELLSVYQVALRGVKPEHFIPDSINNLRTDIIFFEHLQHSSEHTGLIMMIQTQ
jgi:hypothetical protein